MHLHSNHVHIKPYTGPNVPYFCNHFSGLTDGSFIIHLHSNHMHSKPYTGPGAPSFCNPFSGLAFRELYYAFTFKPCAFQTLYQISCSFILQSIFRSSLIMHLHSNHEHFKPYTGPNAPFLCNHFPGPAFRELYYAFTLKTCVYQTLYRTQCSFFLQSL